MRTCGNRIEATRLCCGWSLVLMAAGALAAGPGGQAAGQSWSAMTSGSTEDLYGIWGSGSANVFAVGYPGQILRYGTPSPFGPGICGAGAGAANLIAFYALCWAGLIGMKITRGRRAAGLH